MMQATPPPPPPLQKKKKKKNKNKNKEMWFSLDDMREFNVRLYVLNTYFSYDSGHWDEPSVLSFHHFRTDCSSIISLLYVFMFNKCPFFTQFTRSENILFRKQTVHPQFFFF